MTGARVELRVRDKRAVLVRTPADNTTTGESSVLQPSDIPLGAELTAALHEWARVAAVLDTGRQAQHTETAVLVSRRGRQLATGVAAALRTTVHYHDPVAGALVPVPPAAEDRAETTAEALLGVSYHPSEPVPWLSGSTLALFSSVVVTVAILALTTELGAHVAWWTAAVALVIVTAGVTPALWLARNQPILRWGALGAAIGLLCSWVGTGVLIWQTVS